MAVLDFDYQLKHWSTQVDTDVCLSELICIDILFPLFFYTTVFCQIDIGLKD